MDHVNHINMWLRMADYNRLQKEGAVNAIELRTPKINITQYCSSWILSTEAVNLLITANLHETGGLALPILLVFYGNHMPQYT